VNSKTLKIIFTMLPIFTIEQSLAFEHDSVTPAYVIDAVRNKGLKCDHALSVEKSVLESIPVESSWKLRCSNAAYWVQIIPNIFIHIEKVDPEEDLSTVGGSLRQ